MRAGEIDSAKISAYILQRQAKGLRNATINNELRALKRILNLGHMSTPPKVVSVPHIRLLEENNVRTGFFEDEEYHNLKSALPFHLKPVVTMAFYTGMRKGEILGLRWDQVDLLEGKITLNPRDTKSKEGRVIYMVEELSATLRFQKSIRDTKHPECPWVFFNGDGDQIGRFDKSWSTACKKAGLEGRIFHDFRRTGIRNMVRAGVPESVAMRISGHKTRSVFERYNIVNEDDLRKAAKNISEYHSASDAHNPRTIEEKERVDEKKEANRSVITH